ncbi:hypothetical protein GBF38_022842, partial [Nibea albiflora]
QGTMGDILSNQHLLPATTEVYRQMTCHVVTYCVVMCGFDKRENKGVSLDTRERRSRWETEKQWLTCRGGGFWQQVDCSYILVRRLVRGLISSLDLCPSETMGSALSPDPAADWAGVYLGTSDQRPRVECEIIQDQGLRQNRCSHGSRAVTAAEALWRRGEVGGGDPEGLGGCWETHVPSWSDGYRRS